MINKISLYIMAFQDSVPRNVMCNLIEIWNLQLQKSQNHKTKTIDVSSSEYVYLFGENIFLFFAIAIDL